MGRDLTKTTELNIDTAYGIRKLCNGNLKFFFDKWIYGGSISIQEFYHALKYMEKITPKVEQEVEEAYHMALSTLNVTHEDIVVMPTLEKFMDEIENELYTTETLPQFLQFKQTHLRRLQFYRQILELGLIKIEKTKKSKLI